MVKQCICALVLVLQGFSLYGQEPSLSDCRPLKIKKVLPLFSQVKKYEIAEFSLDIQASYSNPFDPREIQVVGSFTTPSKKVIEISAFYFQDYSRKLMGNREDLAIKGKAQWRLRFCPVEKGEYFLKIRVRDKTGKTLGTPKIKFSVALSQKPGFIRVHPKDRRYFAFDNGKTYIPLGANVCWAGKRGTFDYDTWLTQYGKAGANFFRIWLGPAWTTFALEKIGKPKGRYGLGKFSQMSSYRIDTVLALARKEGLYVMLCLDSYNELRYEFERAWPYWKSTPHNKTNGGPLSRPGQFWNNPEMKRLYKNKLRYLVARWGAYTQVMAWEFWNEVDLVSLWALRPKKIRKWHRDMSRFLRKIDPYKHLQSTSFANSSGMEKIDKLPEMDFVQTHHYGSADMAQELSYWQSRKKGYGKPHLVGEFGASSAGKDSKVDPSGICLHNGLWASLLSGYAGGAMSWWWDNHIHPHKLYFHIRAVSDFIKGIDFGSENFQSLTKTRFFFQHPRKSKYRCPFLGRGLYKTKPQLRLWGLRGKKTTILWIQNPSHTWNLAGLGKIPPPEPPSKLLLRRQTVGKYRVIYWDTYKGKAIKTLILEATKKGLTIPLPPIQRDIALRLEKSM